METFSLTNDLQVSRLSLGGCPFGGHGWGTIDDADSILAIQKAYDLGVNFFDTADVYGFGHSEKILRKALGANRRKVALASKFGIRWDSQCRTWKDASPAYLRSALDASLRRLEVECIDLYYLHWPDDQTPLEQTIEALADLQRQGKIRAIGLSNVSAEQLQLAASIAPVATVQVQFSLVDQEDFRRLAPIAKELSTTLTTWGSLAQGLLSGKYDANTKFEEGDRRLRYKNFQGEKLQSNLRLVEELRQIATKLGKTPVQIALRWLLDTSPVGAVLFGAKNNKQVTDNLGAMSWELPKTMYSRLEKLGLSARASHQQSNSRKIA